MGMQFTECQLEAAEHPQCPQLPSIKGSYFIEGYEAATSKYTDKIKKLEAQIEKMKCCLRMWYQYENERDTPQINIEELLTETQQIILLEIKEKK